MRARLSNYKTLLNNTIFLLYAAVPYVAGKAGSSLGNFVKLIEGARFETQNFPLPEMVQVVLDLSTLLTHYQTEKEGADRIENLEQLVNAATCL